MSFGNHTPESILPRSDSKNPATTCKGLTSSGRLCRRALAASVTKSPAGDHNGVVAVLDEGAAAAFFCWQHKDQAEQLVARSQERSKIVPLKEKSSIDTLIEKVGILDLEDEIQDSPSASRKQRHERRRASHRDKRQRDDMPQEWRNFQSPLMSLPEEVAELEISPKENRKEDASRPPRNRHSSNRVGQSNVRASWSCCIRIADDDDSPAPRRSQQHGKPKPKLHSDATRSPTSHDLSSPYPTSAVSTPIRRKPTNSPEMQQYPQATNEISSTPTSPISTRRPLPTSPPNSQTASFLSLIPSHLSPATTSALLSELSKPISDADQAGYIYIFWLTPESDVSKPDDDVASSLLDSEEYSLSSSPSNITRRHESASAHLATNRLTAQALQRFASVNRGSVGSKKILLKIGRAANVHRRLSQWTKQCGQNITLIRYYPYQQNSTSHDSISPQYQPKRMVPHVHRVERLIHLELSDKRVTDKGSCDACGKIHKEWFEVDATRKGVRDIDEVVRRWVGWAEQSH